MGYLSSLERALFVKEGLWHKSREPPVSLPFTFESAKDYSHALLSLVLDEAREHVLSGLIQSKEAGRTLKAHVLGVEREEQTRVTFAVDKIPSVPNDVSIMNTVFLILSDMSSVDIDQRPSCPHAFGVLSRQQLREITLNIISSGPDSLVFDHKKYDLQRSGVKSNHAYILIPSTKLSTFSHEYATLCSIEKIDERIMDYILNPCKYGSSGLAVHPDGDCAQLKHEFGIFNTFFNSSQLQAIGRATRRSNAASTADTPITLIQGPPGTGKTHTIWGLLNVVHLIQFQEYYKSVIEVLKGVIEERASRPRILVCAPSNGAVMNVLQRVMQKGFCQTDGNRYCPAIIHVGTNTGQQSEFSEFSAENRANKLLNMGKEEWMHWLSHQYHTVKVLEADLQAHLELFYKTRQNSENDGNDLCGKLLAMYEHRDRAVADLARLEHLRPYHEGRCVSEYDLSTLRSALEASFVDEAEIVFTTLASSGKQCLMKISHGFQTLVVDEAAQATESCLLLPLIHGVKHCVLVGDPQQLPSTVLSQTAIKSGYDRSLFERLVQIGIQPFLLTVQYRMRPEIRKFPSDFFYENKLSDANCTSLTSMIDYQALRREHDIAFTPYLIFDTSGGVERRSSLGSIKNEFEAQLCVKLISILSTGTQNIGRTTITLTVITPYSFQCDLVRELVQCLKLTCFDIKVSTIDGFQGRESDIVIFSCVRSAQSGMGFMNDARRLNVALTRAKSTLWILCSSNARVDDLWASLFDDARKRDAVVPSAKVQKLVDSFTLSR